MYKRKVISFPCERCEKIINRYGKSDYEKRSKFCSSCCNKISFTKVKENVIEKKCIECKNILKIEKFGYTGSGHIRTKCIQCSNLLNTFKINSNDYNNLLISQNNVCKICKKEETAKTNKGDLRRLAVDHCHTSGKIRGLLCTNCNNGIGKFFDNINYLKNAINYLKEYEDKD